MDSLVWDLRQNHVLLRVAVHTLLAIDNPAQSAIDADCKAFQIAKSLPTGFHPRAKTFSRLRIDSLGLQHRKQYTESPLRWCVAEVQVCAG